MNAAEGGEPQGAPAASARKPRRGDLLELECVALDGRGRGIAREGEHVFALTHALPGARVLAEVLRRRGGRVEARVRELLRPSPDARAPRCSHHGVCGGCSFQDLDYPAQLRALHEHVRGVLARAGLSAAPVAEVLPSPRVFHYRNKMDFTFGTRRFVEAHEPQGAEAGFALGLHVAGMYRKVLDVQSCALHFEEADGLLTSVRDLARRRGLVPWDVTLHTGLLRHLVLRKGRRSGEILLALVTSSESPELVAPYLEDLRRAHPELTTIVQMVHDRPAAIAIGERTLVHHGTGRIHETLGGVRYAISAGSFFQTNTEQAERLLEVVAEEVGPPGEGVLWDLYCGAGTIALYLARRGQRVIGIEAVTSAVEDARANAAANGIEGASFALGEVERELEGSLAAWPAPAVCVVDPPRAGLHPRALAFLARSCVPRIVYVSCNIEAGARDAAQLATAGYRLLRARPLDLFPHTPHVECVLSLVRES